MEVPEVDVIQNAYRLEQDDRKYYLVIGQIHSKQTNSFTILHELQFVVPNDSDKATLFSSATLQCPDNGRLKKP